MFWKSLGTGARAQFRCITTNKKGWPFGAIRRRECRKIRLESVGRGGENKLAGISIRFIGIAQSSDDVGNQLLACSNEPFAVFVLVDVCVSSSLWSVD